MNSWRGFVTALATAALALAAGAPGALAEFPYELRPADPVPNDLTGKRVWMYASTSDGGPTSQNPHELDGIRGASMVDADRGVGQAWHISTGRPDVGIAVLDSGIKWNDRGAMVDLRNKTRLWRPELPEPLADRGQALQSAGGPERDCADYTGTGYDTNRDGAFNVDDYACDSRVERDPAARGGVGDGPADVLDPQDVLIAFSDGTDADGNGFVDDIVGWDFMDDDNDPYDDVQYGHGTGEARDSTAEANNDHLGGGELGTCPNCMAIHMRVGDSFIADVNRFAQATLYGVDNGALVIQEALGTLNNTKLAQAAVDYAYSHGVVVIASAADEAAQHHNYPSNLEHTVVVNSVTQSSELDMPPSYLRFNGCTNFSSKITAAVPSVSCSSDATGRGAGQAGLIYSAVLDAIAAGKMAPAKGCELASPHPVTGTACPLTANEVRQLFASGAVRGTEAIPPATDGGEPGWQMAADDVDFADIEPSCANPLPALLCTDPNLNVGWDALVLSPAPTKRYPARAGHDQFYGYGRVNLFRTLTWAIADDGRLIPPEVEIESPEWYQQIDPSAASFEVRGHVGAARHGGALRCVVEVAPGSQPNNTEAGSDFRELSLPGSFCDGSERPASGTTGTLATVDVAALKQLFPPETQALGFSGREPGAVGHTSNGRPNSDPWSFTVRVRAEVTNGDVTLRGEDRRNSFLHRDQDMLEGFPRRHSGDLASSPALADLDGDNLNELVYATADGEVHAIRRDGSELRGWPVRGDTMPIHPQARAYQVGAADPATPGTFLASVAVGDIERDGEPEVVAADFEGKVYVWSAAGERKQVLETNPDFSGRPLEPFHSVRRGSRHRTQRGFIGSPVLASIDDDPQLEIIAAAMDRHVYAWNGDGSPVPGFPLLVVDPDKVADEAPADPTTHMVRFDDAKTGDALNQGAIVHTPAVGDITGDGKPEIVVGTNEEYKAGEGNEGDLNVGLTNTPVIKAAAPLIGATGLLTFANSRVYAIDPRKAPEARVASAEQLGAAFLENWPRPVGMLLAELLPVVGEGVTGSPVIGPSTCAKGGDAAAANRVGVSSAAGFGYLFKSDGGSCYGDEAGDNALATDLAVSPGKTDLPAFPAVGHMAFGDIGGRPAVLAPAAGLLRALDLALNDYQVGSQDFVSAWNPDTGQLLPGWPARVNDLQFLTGPSVADITGDGAEEVLAGTASMDLQAFSALGTPVSRAWPKLTGDWMVANPLIGDFGVKATDADARQTVIASTRNGTQFAYATAAPACSPASWPRFHHDNHNTGTYGVDSVAPGAAEELKFDGATLSWLAPGDDLLCGTAERYEIRTSQKPIKSGNFAAAQEVAGAPQPGEPGAPQQLELPADAGRYVTIRALDEAGNPGRLAVLDLKERGRSPKGRR